MLKAAPNWLTYLLLDDDKSASRLCEGHTELDISPELSLTHIQDFRVQCLRAWLQFGYLRKKTVFGDKQYSGMSHSSPLLLGTCWYWAWSDA